MNLGKTRSKMQVYFDNAATTPVHESVVEIIADNLRSYYGNPSSSHYCGRDAKAQLEGSRRTIATLLGCKPSEILFTSCGTESNNAIIHHAIQTLKVTKIYTTVIEHPAIYTTLLNLKDRVSVEYIDLHEDGRVDIASLDQRLKLNKEVAFITIMHANNEMGALNDIKAVGDLVSKMENVYFHSDMVQTMGHLPIKFSEILVDFASASAHKFHGPKGVGFLFIRQPHQLTPMMTGGSQERGYRSGTENLASIVGMAHALELATKEIDSDVQYLNDLRSYMRKKLTERISDIQFLTNESDSLCTVLSVIFPDRFDKDTLLFQLDMKGIACSGGSACSSGANKASHVLAQFSIPEKCKVIRFSFSKFNNRDEIDFCVEKISELQLELAANA